MRRKVVVATSLFVLFMWITLFVLPCMCSKSPDMYVPHTETGRLAYDMLRSTLGTVFACVPERVGLLVDPKGDRLAIWYAVCACYDLLLAVGLTLLVYRRGAQAGMCNRPT